jgi:hypothetical protein
VNTFYIAYPRSSKLEDVLSDNSNKSDLRYIATDLAELVSMIGKYEQGRTFTDFTVHECMAGQPKEIKVSLEEEVF